MNEQDFGKIDSVVDEDTKMKIEYEDIDVFKSTFTHDMPADLVNKKVPTMTAQDFLKQAQELMDERGKQYDSKEGERSAGKIATAFNAISGHNISASDAWMFLLILKLVRQSTTDTFHADSAEDATAYCALMAEQLMKDGH